MEVVKKYGGCVQKITVMTQKLAIEQLIRVGVLIVQDIRLLTMTFGSNMYLNK